MFESKPIRDRLLEIVPALDSLSESDKARLLAFIHTEARYISQRQVVRRLALQDQSASLFPFFTAAFRGWCGKVGLPYKLDSLFLVEVLCCGVVIERLKENTNSLWKLDTLQQGFQFYKREAKALRAGVRRLEKLGYIESLQGTELRGLVPGKYRRWRYYRSTEKGRELIQSLGSDFSRRQREFKGDWVQLVEGFNYSIKHLHRLKKWFNVDRASYYRHNRHKTRPELGLLVPDYEIRFPDPNKDESE